MDFLKRLWPFAGHKQRSANNDNGVWTTLYPSSEIERALLESNKEWVYVSVDKVAKAVASVRFKVMRYSRSGDDEEIFDSPLVDFLEAPAPDFTGKDFVYLNTAYKELTGNAFWEIERKSTIRPLLPPQVRPILTNGKLVGYEYHDGMKKRVLALDKVLHDRYIDPRKPYWGVGRLEKIGRWVDTSFYANEFLRLFFINGAQFGGFIETEEESEDRIKLIKLGLQNEHVGVENAHKMAVLPKGSKFSPATANMSEMQFRELDEQYRDKILSAFGVPKTLVGFTTEVNRASAEASEYIFAKYTVKPAADDLIEFLNTKVAPLFDKSGELYFAYDDFVPENMEMKIKERESALAKHAYKTINEVRAEVGLPPVDGGDEVPEPPQPIQPGQNPQGKQIAIKRVQRPANDNQPKKAVPIRARHVEHKARLVEDLAAKVADVVAEHLDPDELAHKAFVGRVGDHEKLLADKVRDFNNRQERDVVENVGRITKDVSKADLFDYTAQVGLMVDFVTPLLTGLMIEQAVAEWEAQGFDGAFDRSVISRIVELAAKRLAKSYNDTTRTLLAKALNEGIGEGDDLGQLAARVRQVYEFSNQVRADMVARTESFYIANKASREAYRQSGVVKSVRWYTAEDERVCEFCGPMHGRTIGVDEVFFEKGATMEGRDGGTLTLDYRKMDVPPLHTSCRCFIRPDIVA